MYRAEDGVLPPLDAEEWQRRTRENIEACDKISEKYGVPFLTVEDRAQVGRMVGRQMQWEHEARRKKNDVETKRRDY